MCVCACVKGVCVCVCVCVYTHLYSCHFCCFVNMLLFIP